jgi:ligand-binding sensor domain-containing protein
MAAAHQAAVSMPGLPGANLHSIYEDRQGTLWFALAGYGLLRLSEDKLTRYTVADGLASNDVNRIYQDREGTLWVGTAGGSVV